MSRFIAIDVDAGGLFVTAGTARGPAVKVDHAFPVSDGPGSLTEATAPALATKLKAALAAAGVGPAPVLIAVGRDRVVFKDVRHPITAPTEEPKVVRFQAERDLAEPAANLHLDYVPLPTPDGSVEKRATAVFVRKELYAAAEKLCDEAGLKLAGFTARPYATAAALRRAIAAAAVPPPERPNAPVAVFTIWDGGGEFVVSRGESLVFSRSVPASALLSEAALVGEAKRSLAAFASQQSKDKLDAVYLCEGHGGGSWAARLQAALPLPVHAFDPLAGHPAADAVPTALRGRFTAGVGLLAARAAGPLPINFVSPRQPRAQTNKSAVWAIIASMLLLLVIGGVAFGAWFLHRQMDGKIVAANARVSAADASKKKAQLDKNKQDAVDDFRKRNVNALDLFYDVTDVLPNVGKLRLKDFDLLPIAKVEAKAGSGPGAAKPPTGKPGSGPPPVEPVATLKLQFVTASDTDDNLPTQVRDELVKDTTHFANPQMTFAGVGTKREATVTAGLLPRKATSFTRVLKAEFPKLPPQVEPVFVPPPAPINPEDPP